MCTDAHRFLSGEQDLSIIILYVYAHNIHKRYLNDTPCVFTIHMRGIQKNYILLIQMIECNI